MEIKLVCSTVFFEIEESANGFKVEDFIISNDKTLLRKEIQNKTFVTNIGLKACYSLDNNPFLLSKADSSYYFNQLKVDSDIKLSEIRHEHVQFFFMCLWFIKDCSSNADTLYTYNIEENNAYPRYRNIFISNASGEYTNTKFSYEELANAYSIFHKAASLMNKGLDAKKFIESKPVDNAQTTLGSMHYIPYNDRNRIDRALMFLSLARANSFLPLKISFYVAIFETLFTTDNSEVTHKVSERISYYLASEFETKIDTFKLIKTAYTIRSKFVHGQHLGSKFKTREKLINISKEIDQLTRILLLKIIKTDSEYFLQDNNRLDEWLTSLVFL
ncbi:hypothetical protein WJR50_15975 [Catalinimonas sp. 4WD22]|uniref:hypothetical protein n=1 Tax=Catalinimonas locisalis TaxID=3133978 RepID=UPI00310141BE